MATNYLRTVGINSSILNLDIPIYNSIDAKQYPNTFQYVDNLVDKTPASKITKIKIGAPIKVKYGSVYLPWRNQPFAFVFDWFPGLVAINEWPIEILIQMSIYNELHQAENILPFCMNISGEDKINWDSCRYYSHGGISAWEINKTTNRFPSKWLGIYFKENMGVNHPYNGENHFTYWLEKFKSGYIPKICVFGIFDSDGIAQFNSGSATDDISLTILNEDVPKQIENVHIDAYNAGTNCGSIRKNWKITVTQEVVVNPMGPTVGPMPTAPTGIQPTAPIPPPDFPRIDWPTGLVMTTALPMPTSIIMPTTIAYDDGVIPLPLPGQKLIKINPTTGSTWVSYDGGSTWYVEDTVTGFLNGPYSQPYWDNFVEVFPPNGDPSYWFNPFASTDSPHIGR